MNTAGTTAATVNAMVSQTAMLVAFMPRSCFAEERRDLLHHDIGIDRLVQKRICARLKCPEFIGRIALRRQDDDRYFLIELLELTARLIPVHLGHGYVENHQRRRIVPEAFDRLLAVVRDGRSIAE